MRNLLARFRHDDFDLDWDEAEVCEGHKVSVIVTVAFTTDETEHLQALALASGLRLTEQIRQSVRKDHLDRVE